MLKALIAVVLAALVVSGIHPYDRTTWIMEVAPVFMAAPALFLTYRRFPLTDLLYIRIAIHAVVLIAGAAYTYARVPLGFWLQDWLGRRCWRARSCCAAATSPGAAWRRSCRCASCSP